MGAADANELLEAEPLSKVRGSELSRPRLNVAGCGGQRSFDQETERQPRAGSINTRALGVAILRSFACHRGMSGIW